MNDSKLVIDEAKLNALRSRAPWRSDPKHFTKVKISAAAATKMISHALSGVEKGLASSNGMPIEIMGLLQGHIDTDDSHALIVVDAFPLPVEGTETSVVSDRPEVINYMVSLGDRLEETSTESGHFMGWYHSHPFDVAPNSNAFLSGTDVSTQLSWQTPEDRAGNPWLALVVDPLGGLAREKPDIGAFRCYPPDYVPPVGLAPDGSTWADERARNGRWGDACVSYYQLGVELFTTQLGSKVLAGLAQDTIWTQVLAASTAGTSIKSLKKMASAVRSLSSACDAGCSACTSGRSAGKLQRRLRGMAAQMGGGRRGLGGVGGIGGEDDDTDDDGGGGGSDDALLRAFGDFDRSGRGDHPRGRRGGSSSRGGMLELPRSGLSDLREALSEAVADHTVSAVKAAAFYGRPDALATTRDLIKVLSEQASVLAPPTSSGGRSGGRSGDNGSHAVQAALYESLRASATSAGPGAAAH